MFQVPGSVITPFILTMGLVYLAREILIPVALAILITFILSPLVMALQRRGLHRGIAVLVMVVGTTFSMSVVGLIVTQQVIDLSEQFPVYKVNIVRRVQSVRAAAEGPLDQVSHALVQFRRELSGRAPEPKAGTVAGGDKPLPGISTVQAAGTEDAPLFVEMVGSSDAFELMHSVVGPFLSPLATMALVLVLVVFMLLERENLRDRFFALIGENQLSVSTLALDDAAKGVSRFLLIQSLLNGSFGLTIAIGLFLIGVPNPILWGFLAGMLRYIPYVGAWLAALMPFALAIAASSSWMTPSLTLLLFVVVELITAHLIEPWVYGRGIGISPTAILLTALFWTWMWGGIGLILATPLTVCLVVMSRHVPQLQFLTILLGSENALPPDARLYQRLLARDTLEAGEIVEEAYRKSSLVEVIDEVILPALQLAEGDRHGGRLEPERHVDLGESLQVIMEAVDDRPVVPSSTRPAVTVVCLPARDVADEIAGHMVGRALKSHPVNFEVLSSRLTAGEMVEKVGQMKADAVFVSAIPPYASQHARYIFKRLRNAYPDLKIMVALWGVKPGSKSYRSLACVGAGRLTTSVKESLELLDRWLPIQAIQAPEES